MQRGLPGVELGPHTFTEAEAAKHASELTLHVCCYNPKSMPSAEMFSAETFSAETFSAETLVSRALPHLANCGVLSHG